MRAVVPAPARDLVRYPMRRAELRARLMRPYWQRRLYAFGERAILHRPGGVFGAHQISIGAGSLILGGCYLSVETRAWHYPAPVLSIGARVGIRPYCMISASESIVIEDDVIIGAFSSVIDSDHTFAEGRPNVMHNSVAAEAIHIGRGTWLAERVAVLRGSSIGRCCIVGANSVVRGELPDYSIAAGAPARIIGEVTGVDADASAFSERLW
jgi:lipopolysaccharide O-acetyltransferase